MEATAATKMRLILATGPYSWHMGFDRHYKTLYLIGVAETEIPNVKALWALTLRWRWPPWHHVSFFSQAN